ncbi:hypothetical protein [Mesorhizobium sp. B1-1-8]|uniref:hypothetical protein n=1 Tax=Mesorhizobium sp. B1-1-8 TaxID=2589976 RepID=UPI0011296676|nr:hypothetical protein [Mesorhizobium sp. B1-1-8]UCI06315.1 hypothetical protein FJ974_21205 [Mesorhizobium sp. B1-1-8]
MTHISIRPELPEAENQAANDNHRAVVQPEISILDLIPGDEDVADIARRAERLGNAVVIAMALWLTLAPAVYVALIYGM